MPRGDAIPRTLRRRELAGWALGACASLATVHAAASEVELVVQLRGVRAMGGVLRVALFDSAEAWARRHEGVVARQVAAADDAWATVRFAGLAPGRYAVTAFHDANDNNRFDRVLGSIPLEGVAVSNDAVLIGEPTFEELAVDVAASRAIVLRLRYPDDEG